METFYFTPAFTGDVSHGVSLQDSGAGATSVISPSHTRKGFASVAKWQEFG